MECIDLLMLTDHCPVRVVWTGWNAKTRWRHKTRNSQSGGSMCEKLRNDNIANRTIQVGY